MRSMISSMTGAGKSSQQNGDLDFDDEARALFERFPIDLNLEVFRLLVVS